MALLRVEHSQKLTELLENGYQPKADEILMWHCNLPVLYISHEGKFVTVNDCADGRELTVESKDLFKLTYNFK